MGVRKILVVDDHPIVRLGLERLISGAGDLELCGAVGSPTEAVAAVERTRPHLVVIEISLAGGGLELIKELAGRERAPVVLALSRHDEKLFAGRALDAGAAGYLEKAASPETILGAIRKTLDGEIYLSPEMTQRLLQAAADGEPAEAATVVGVLTDRELEVFGLLGRGLTTREVADRLGRSVKTIETHRERIKAKLGVDHHNELIRRAVEWSLREAPD